MKRLYLIRHAKSRKDILGIKDKERPLSEKGKKDARYIGGLLKKRGIKAQVLYSSPAERALDTARIIAGKICFPRGKIQAVSSLYRSTIPKLLRVIKKINDEFDSAMIFGHNPEFHGLVNYLTPRPIIKFPACGVFGIDFKIDSWSRVSRKKGKIAFSGLPKRFD